jgi:hypothetical protein
VQAAIVANSFPVLRYYKCGRFDASQPFEKELCNMPIDQHSPLWSVLADWVKILLTLPDPPPDALRQVNEAVILTAISALSHRLSPELSNEFGRALPALAARMKTAA